MIKRAYFHPLSHLPGNKLLSSTYFFTGIAGLSGRSHYFHPLGHKHYGKIFRFSPDIVSVTDKDMIKEVNLPLVIVCDIHLVMLILPFLFICLVCD
jgi:hypothetical protein